MTKNYGSPTEDNLELLRDKKLMWGRGKEGEAQLGWSCLESRQCGLNSRGDCLLILPRLKVQGSTRVGS